ncbi:YdbH family protein [Providencia stuartii]|uniref:YdbH family protein n=1 Tax=Providencia stuartii TaxID=588 RepID=UPI00111CA1D1|nr:YdbH family protein [Providencia stuartii]
MKRALKYLLLSVIGCLVLLSVLWVTVTRWLPVVAKVYLPENVTLSLSQPVLNNQQLLVANIQLKVGNCLWFDAKDSRFSLFPMHLLVKTLSEDNQCLSQLSKNEHTDDSPISIIDIIDSLPAFSVVIENVEVSPWGQYQGSFWLHNRKGASLALDYNGENVDLSAYITPTNQLVIERFSVQLPDQEQRLYLNGELSLPLTTDELPSTGVLDAEFVLSQPAKLLQAKLHWQDKQGSISLYDKSSGDEIAHLPWQFDANVFRVVDGRWQWEESGIPLHGGIAFQIKNWQADIADMVISGRTNMVTEGKKGKANIVLTLPENKINLLETAITFGLNGQLKYDDMILDIHLPSQITGPIVAPAISFRSGSLLRAYGRVSPTLLLQEARLPLAGTTLSAEGISGRLQAILKVKEQYWGSFAIHLDGKASKFTPDQGKWFWNYWGNAHLPSLAANWDIKGQGSWQDTLITLNTLNTGFDQIKYGLLSMKATRLILTKPLLWQRDPIKEHFQGELQLTSDRMQFGSASYLPKITTNAALNGKSPADFLLKADLSTKEVGPIVIFSRWDGERFRGQARWPEQSVSAFQTLIPSNLGITLREGKLFSQAAFSIDPETGFIAGGHWRVENTGLWLKDGEVSGLNFVLPWKLQDSTWTLGEKSPVKLRIKQLTNLFELTEIRADLSGTYPPTEIKPLKLSNVGFKMLGGEVSLDLLRWPQKQPATIRLHQIELSRLFTILKVTQFAASGKVDGELPFYLNNPEWIVRNGWMENSGPLALRLDTQFVESIKKDNISAGSAMGWLQYLEISCSRTDVNITNLGLLTMKTIIQGFNSQESKKREVHLNYTHEENIFQLWRSLRFGSNLEEWLEKNL